MMTQCLSPIQFVTSLQILSNLLMLFPKWKHSCSHAFECTIAWLKDGTQQCLQDSVVLWWTLAQAMRQPWKWHCTTPCLCHTGLPATYIWNWNLETNGFLTNNLGSQDAAWGSGMSCICWWSWENSTGVSSCLWWLCGAGYRAAGNPSTTPRKASNPVSALCCLYPVPLVPVGNSAHL